MTECRSFQVHSQGEVAKFFVLLSPYNFARAQRLGWYGHIEIMQETRMVKAIPSWKPISKRPTGRPKIRWEDDVKKHVQRLKVPNWKTLSRIEEDGKKWLRRPKLCTKSCRAVLRRRRLKAADPSQCVTLHCHSTRC